MERKITEQAEEYAKGFNAEQQVLAKNAFEDGAFWFMDSVWHNADEKPKDGEYLTILKVNEKIVIEIAPWKNGKYQGSHHIEVYIGKTEIVRYANIYDLLPKGGIE